MDIKPEILWLEETGSTNTVCMRKGRNGAKAWTVVVAERQTNGRGRLDRQWQSAAGKSLLFSVLLRPEIPICHAGLIPLAAATAMEEALRETCGAEAMIKWPNDLVIGGKKVCGILMESVLEEQGTGSALPVNVPEKDQSGTGQPDMQRLGFAVAGLGLNVYRGSYPAELSETATCLEETCRAVPGREEILLAFLKAFSERITLLGQGETGYLLQEYAGKCATIGSRVQVSGSRNFRGTARSLGQDGSLVVEDENGGLNVVYSGDVSVRGVMGYV